MNEIKCPHDLNQFLLGEPIFEDTFTEENCEASKFYSDCYHCFATAIASRDHQLKNTINKIREIDDDCISRQAVLDTLDKMDKALDVDRTVENYKQLLAECYKDLPPVKPKEKTGHWIDNHTTCDCCGWQMIDDVIESPNIVFFPFCPNCGAKMIEPKESEVSE